MTNMLRILTMSLFLLPLGCVAKDTLPAPVEPNPIEVITYEEGDNTITEYRVRGFLYSTKVAPKKGKPYYLVDANGNNQVLKAGGSQVKVPSWTLFSW